jgi:beta-glucosidase
LVVSDWTGTYDTAPAIRAGCDVEMPGPAKHRTITKVLDALDAGELSPNDIERAAGNVLYLVDRTKGLDGPPERPERPRDTPETRQLIRQVGVEGLTLLKNESKTLPIKGAKKIAIIGPNAKRAIAGGGGSATLKPYYLTTPFEGVSSRTDADLVFVQGCDSRKWLPLANDYCRTSSREPSVTVEFYYGDRFLGEPAEIQTRPGTDLWLWDSAPKKVLPAFSFKVKTTLTPATSGFHEFSFSSVGPGRMFLNGELFIDVWNWTEEGEAMFSACKDVIKSTFLEEAVPVKIVIESTNEIRPLAKMSIEGKSHEYGGCRIGYREEEKVDLEDEAVKVARDADVAIVVVGLDDEWESEGYDRQSMDLPKDGSQDRLIEAVLEANPRTIVVNQSGTPVTMRWADKVPAILQAWYQGQEAGNALADVLFGIQSPSGKLPTTFPKRLEDNPAYHNWPGENLKTVYGEGIYIGYRHYERSKIEPLFPFGHGLSYTTFTYGTPTISEKVLTESDSIRVSVPITNSGRVAAREIVQGYIRDPKSTLPRPEKELQAFAKVFLEAGETKTVDLKFDKYSVGYYDTSLDQNGAWIAEEGTFDVLIGASSADIR